MVELLVANIIYVSYRLVVTAHIVKFLYKYIPYGFAVLLAAQISFLYDGGVFAYLFQAKELPALMDFVQANVLYTFRVGVAWWIIKILWDQLSNYYLAVFIGAQLTFIVDYFIFEGVF